MNRRKRKLVRLDLQIKVVFITLFVAGFTLLVNFQLLLAGLWSLSGQLQGTGVDSSLESMRSLVISRFLIAFGIAVPLSFSVAVLYSFRFCGPIYRFGQYLSGLVAGRWDRACSLRAGDDLKDVCDALNAAVGTFRGRIESQHEVLEEVAACLDAGHVVAAAGESERLEGLRDRIRVEAVIFRERLGDAQVPDEILEKELLLAP